MRPVPCEPRPPRRRARPRDTPSGFFFSDCLDHPAQNLEAIPVTARNFFVKVERRLFFKGIFVFKNKESSTGALKKNEQYLDKKLARSSERRAV